MSQAQARIDESRQTQSRNDESRQSQKQYYQVPKDSPMANIIPAELVEMGKQRVEVLMEIQKELFDVFQEINQAWFDRARSAATVHSELISKLSAARSVPETADAYQQCMGKRMEQMVEDGRQLFADGQKIVNLSTKFLTNGSGPNGSAA
jgi:hypothetical protein